MKKSFNYIYGPVDSWRLGASLGIDLLSRSSKVCSFDCCYCQLGRTTTFTTERRLYVPTEDILKEIDTLPDIKIDYLTFSGIGEPTLARNLGEAILAVSRIRSEPVAVFTNASLMSREDVRKDLLSAHFVIAKLDACSQSSLEAVNRPAPEIDYDEIVEGLKQFRADFTGKMALQIMFVRANRDLPGEIARVAREIRPDEVQINTPLRPCEDVPLSREIIGEIKSFFKGLKFVSVYDAVKSRVEPISNMHTMRRRGKFLGGACKT